MTSSPPAFNSCGLRCHEKRVARTSRSLFRSLLQPLPPPLPHAPGGWCGGCSAASFLPQRSSGFWASSAGAGIGLPLRHYQEREDPSGSRPYTNPARSPLLAGAQLGHACCSVPRSRALRGTCHGPRSSTSRHPSVSRDDGGIEHLLGCTQRLPDAAEAEDRLDARAPNLPSSTTRWSPPSQP